MKRMIMMMAMMAMSCLFAERMPDFRPMMSLDQKMTSLNAYIQGNTLTLVSLFTLECPYCHKELKDFVELSESNSFKKVGFVALFMEDNVNNVKSLIQRENVCFPVLLPDHDYAKHFAIRGVPFTVVVGKNRQIIQRIPGYIPLESMKKMISEALKTVK